MRIAFVTTHDELVVFQDYDREIHLEAAKRNGYSIEFVPWWNEDADWESYDLVVIRSPWDYSKRYDEFLKFLDRVSLLRTVWNPPELIRWNLNKRYLAELDGAGVPIVPTQYLATTTPESWQTSVKALSSGDNAVNEIVVKPTISAGSWLTGRFEATDQAAYELAQEIIESGRDVMLQPAIPSVATWGELAVMWFNGEVSHTFRKGPMLDLGGDLIGGTYLEKVELFDPPAASRPVIRAAHEAILGVARARGWLDPDAQLLYQRLDLVELEDGSWALLEAELFEPAFFFPVTTDPAATADTFARAVLSLAASSQ